MLSFRPIFFFFSVLISGSDTEVGQDANLDLANYDDFEAFLNDFTKMDEEKNGT